MEVISELGIIFPWADPDTCLDKYSLDQLTKLREAGWKAKETEARLFWGILGEIMSGKKRKTQNPDRQGFTGLQEFKQAHPEAAEAGDAWKLNT